MSQEDCSVSTLGGLEIEARGPRGTVRLSLKRFMADESEANVLGEVLARLAAEVDCGHLHVIVSGLDLDKDGMQAVWLMLKEVVRTRSVKVARFVLELLHLGVVLPEGVIRSEADRLDGLSRWEPPVPGLPKDEGAAFIDEVSWFPSVEALREFARLLVEEGWPKSSLRSCIEGRWGLLPMVVPVDRLVAAFILADRWREGPGMLLSIALALRNPGMTGEELSSLVLEERFRPETAASVDPSFRQSHGMMWLSAASAVVKSYGKDARWVVESLRQRGDGLYQWSIARAMMRAVSEGTGFEILLPELKGQKEEISILFMAYAWKMRQLACRPTRVTALPRSR